MVDILLVGNVDPQASAVHDVLWKWENTPKGRVLHWVDAPDVLAWWVEHVPPDLIIVAGWRRLIPPDILAIPRLGTVGFHSAKLPEYPGRAPVPWTLLRGDRIAYNTLLYLDEGVDTGDLIAVDPILVDDDETPDTLYEKMAASCQGLLRYYLPSILDGTAPRIPQDPAKRGPLTTKDGWDLWHGS